ncbi:MAG: MerR family transcriptional regulator [Actinobacteria bacterium]|nr:MerR family transcriptional regulator [Actinomycetota bacterium]
MPDQWRIDDLAHRAGVTVDTIRYYQREGLLPPAERAGRNKLYGPEHLHRLEQIRELQQRRFSLAAIRSLMNAERPGLVEGVFGAESAAYTFDDLVEKSGVDRTLAGRLREVEFLRDPVQVGRDAYDSTDLDAVSAVAELSEVGLRDDVIVEIAGIYAKGIETMQEQVLDVFGGRRGPEWDADDLTAFQFSMSEVAGRMLPLVSRLVSYAHYRTLQRLTLDAIEEGRATS